ncbi:MAG: alkaline phosphatase family protein [Desulfobacteraceae bacterium]|jgi:2,3-bisphosphoglycerate-independent phosphoglycerate mutase
MKVVLVLLDGLGDRSYAALGHRTPLEAARTPNLDRMASQGCSGLFHASTPGLCLPSETAHYRLFGYGMDEFPGRGLLEGVGHGVPFDDRDVLCVAHLFHAAPDVEGGPLLLKQTWKSLQAEDAELQALYSVLTPFDAHGVQFQLHRIRGNEGILVMKGPVSHHVSDSDPMVKGRPMGRIVPLEPNPEPDEADRTALALNAFLVHSQKELTRHDVNRARVERGMTPADFLATQRCGRRVLVDPFCERWGMKALMIAMGAVFAGIATELGMTFHQAQDGEDSGADLAERIGIALADTHHEFVHVHTKAPDEAAHRGDPAGKAAVIEELDRGLEALADAVESGEELLVAVTADHSTPCGTPLIHSGETVPVLMAGPTVRRDNVTGFDEIQAARGGLGLLRGEELMLTLLNAAGRSVLFGHRLGAKQRPYVPKDYDPFRETDGSEPVV